jgi:alpha-mannosidase
MNTLASTLGLLDDDIKREDKLFRLCRDLGEKILTPVDGEFAWRFQPADVSPEEALAADWQQWPEFTSHTVWAKKQGHTWFAAEVTVPEGARGKTFVLRFTSQWQDRPGSTDPQCLAYLDGEIAQALDGNHNELVIATDAVPGTKRILRVNAFTFFDRPLVGFKVELLVRHHRAEKLYFDLQTPLEVAVRLPQTDNRRHAIMNLVEASLRALDRRGVVTPEFEASLDAAEAIAAQIYELTDFEQQPTVTAVGHTHLDVGWLWRVMHTRDKTGRSFATVLNLMTEYPGFVFMYNQSVLFNFIKTDYPDIWEKLKQKVKSGQFEIEGAMWVEPDANIVSGESMVRQILRGRQFHIDEFDVTPRTVWLPDTFGYSANMPQILRRSGLEYFITSKLSWNDTDRHPYDTFFWRGIDGTVAKAQLLTAQEFDSTAIFTTYNSDLSVSHVMGAWKRYEPKSANSEVLVCYGYGDGGGGPTRAMIERGERLARGIPGAPRVRMEGIVPFLERLSEKMDSNPKSFPSWNGELYLQYHRGTLTNVAKNKANNRKAERVMREAEFLGALAMGAGLTYPTEKLREYWDIVLINQFHDILPGTSIAEVYVDSDAEYGQLFSELASGNGIWQSAARAIAPAKSDELRLFNFAGHGRDNALVRLPGAPEGAALATGGEAKPLQILTNADGSTVPAAPVAAIPSLGWAGAALVNGAAAPATSLSVSTSHLENALLKVTFDNNGEITSVYDKTRRRELIAAGETANRLVAYEDKPLNWDAWDIDRYFEEQFWKLSDGPVTVSVVETGPYRAALRIERTYSASRVVQVVSLEEGARQVEFDTFLDWNDRQSVLKAEFPFDLNVSEIRSEIQFGHVKRATHRNTSWDRARFEASMHRWIDISEPDFGAALINDCKYAYDAHEQLVRLTLVRGARFPDPDSDRGEHRLSYALKLHDGLADFAGVSVAAEAFNNPVAVVGNAGAIAASAPAPASFSFATASAPNVTLETVKKAEKSDHLIVRLFEHANQRAETTVTFGVPVKSVAVVNLMEEGGEPLALEGNAVSLSLRPFEIATLRLELA